MDLDEVLDVWFMESEDVADLDDYLEEGPYGFMEFETNDPDRI